MIPQVFVKTQQIDQACFLDGQRIPFSLSGLKGYLQFKKM